MYRLYLEQQRAQSAHKLGQGFVCIFCIAAMTIRRIVQSQHLPHLQLKQAKRGLDDQRRKRKNIHEAIMAFAQDIQTADRGTSFFKELGERYARYQTYRATLRELSELTTRDLADLGIHRSSIRAIAHEAAYGA